MQQLGASTPATTSRAVQLESFGGPEVLNLREVPAPQAGPGQIRVRVTAAGLNPMDWIMTCDAATAARFGLSLPCGLSEGLPVGLQLVGPQFAENTLFRIGHALEQAIDFDYVPERLR